MNTNRSGLRQRDPGGDALAPGRGCGPGSRRGALRGWLLLGACCLPVLCRASVPGAPVTREVLVPYEDLDLLLGEGTDRVLMKREVFQALLEKAAEAEATDAPEDAVMTHAAYDVRIDQERAAIQGLLTLERLNPGVRPVELDLSGIGLQSLKVEDRSAAVGRLGNGRLAVLLDQSGRCNLTLEAVAPLQTAGARQTLQVRLPTPAATRLVIRALGDVDVVSGAEVIRRTYREDQDATELELVPPRGELNLVLTRNRKLQRDSRVVVARTVLVDRLTAEIERLEARVSLDILHRPEDRFAFRVPPEFEVTLVETPNLESWGVEDDGQGAVLRVRLQEEASDRVVIRVEATRARPELEGWRFPRLVPLDVVGQVAVVGVLAEPRLTGRALRAEGCIPVDRSLVLDGRAAENLRPVAAYYAPGGDYHLAARFTERPASRDVASHVRLHVAPEGLTASGGFVVTPGEEALFEVSFAAPRPWSVTSVTGGDGRPLPFDVMEADPRTHRIRVHLPRSVAPGADMAVFFEAAGIPGGWLDPWTEATVEAPVFSVVGAERERGAIVIVSTDDLDVQVASIDGLTPLDARRKADFGLQDQAVGLAFEYHAQPYRADLKVIRPSLRATAETFSFYRFDRSSVQVRHEVRYHIEQGTAREVRFRLPGSTPGQIAVEGLDQVEVKETTSVRTDDHRTWTIRLAREHHGQLGLAASYDVPVRTGPEGRLLLPAIRAEDVEFQSGRMAVEGNPEWAIRVEAHPRRVDIGELVEAEYQPGRRLLGAFAFVGVPVPLMLSVERPGLAELPEALIQRAELFSAVSSRGVVQTSARFTLLSRTSFLELRLPPHSELWSVLWNDRPLLPQQQDQRILLGLPAKAGENAADLRVVYETPIGRFGTKGRIQQEAPRLFAVDRSSASTRAVPAAEVRWTVAAPVAYQVTRYGGTLEPDVHPRADLAAVQVAGLLYHLAGGIDGKKGLVGIIRGLLVDAFVGMGSALGGRDAYDVGGATTRSRQPGGPTTPSARQENMATFDEQRMDDVGAETEAFRSVERKLQAPKEEASQRPTSVPMTPARKARLAYELEGKRSLEIDVSNLGATVRYSSLGTAPRLDVTLEQRRRRDAVAWALGLGVIVGGIGRIAWRRRLMYVAGILFVSTLLAAAPGAGSWAPYLKAAFYAGCLLILCYAVIDILRGIRSILAKVAARLNPFGSVALLAVMVLATTAAAEDRRPVSVPDDVLIVPWDGEAVGITPSDDIWIPTRRYRELWDQAYPDPDTIIPAPPVPFAWSEGGYQARLDADDVLVLAGRWQLMVFAKEPVHIPLHLDGALLSRAALDGSPALLHPAGSEVADPQNRQIGHGLPPDGGRLDLLARGPGLHQVELECRIKVARQGGWRVARAVLPAGPVTALELTVPQADSEVMVHGAPDQARWVTEAPDQRIVSVLGFGGGLDLRWRPSSGVAVTDTDLSVEVESVFDIQESALLWRGSLDIRFRGAERDMFTLQVPADYLVERVSGSNLRGWDRDAGSNRLNIYLLKPATAKSSFGVALRAVGLGIASDPVRVQAPLVELVGASRQTGRILVRQSPLLELRGHPPQGVRRVSLNEQGPGDIPTPDSPLGILPLQAYEYAGVPYDIAYQVRRLPTQLTATLESVLQVTEQERRFESRVRIDCGDSPRYQLPLDLPEDLEIQSVHAPGVFEWDVSEDEGRRQLIVRFAAGVTGESAIVVEGQWGGSASLNEAAIPILRVMDADRQRGEIAIQTDEAFDVSVSDLRNLESVLRDRVFGWLQPAQRKRTRLALRYQDGDAAGRLRLEARPSRVEARSVTNARVTDRAVEETTLIHFSIREAGVRRVEFELPAALASARIRVPFLRTQEITPVPERGAVRVSLDLQDAVRNELKVLIEQDRVLTGAEQVVRPPRILTGRTDARYLAVENAGRDEVVVSQTAGVSELSRGRQAYALVAELLAGGATQAYAAESQARDPRLTFTARARDAVETAGASIGLARATVILDAHGAYRARQVFHLQNRTEPVLTVELPPDAELWAAKVAGDVVKPLAGEAGRKPVVHLPLVQTESGELDYQVELTYAGSLPDLSAHRRVRIPLIRSVNLGVELSQVRLFAPRTHLWAGFSGTLEPVQSQGDLEAGYLSYQNKMVERLTHTLKFGSVFEKVRAGKNLEYLQDAQSQLTREAASRFGGNERIGDQIVVARQLLNDAERELREADLEGMATSDNRMNLVSAYESQSNAIRDQGVAFESKNWSGDVGIIQGAAEAAGPQVDRLKGWLDVNALQQAVPELAAPESDALEGMEPSRSPEPAVVRTEDQLMRLGIAGGDKGQAKKEDPSSSRRSRQNLAVQYQQDFRSAAGQIGALEAAGKTVQPERPGQQGLVEALQDGMQQFSRRDRDGAAGAAPAGRAERQAGLMSLEVELPSPDSWKWELLAFESPRSAVDLSGHAISRRAIQGWKRLATAAGAAVVAWFLLQAMRGRRLDPSSWLALCNLLVIAGLVGLLLGIFPTGSVVVAVGALVGRQRARRIMRAA